MAHEGVEEVIEEEEDHVVAEYDIFITPELEEQIYLLQYPTRSRSLPYNARAGNMPVEMRIKPKTGFMELDLGLDVRKNFDKYKGVVWGDALDKTHAEGNDLFGLSSGFGKGQKASPAVASDSVREEREVENVDNRLAHFESSVSDGKVLQKQTLGGQIIRPEPGRPMYMLGAFRGNELHLSSVTGVVAMRPQFHHIDAKSQIVKSKQQRAQAAAEAGRSESRLIAQRAHNADDEEMNMAKTENFLNEAASEKWRRLDYYDEDSDEAYASYSKTLFLNNTQAANALSSPWNNDEFLDAISIPRIEPGNRVKKKPPLTRKELADMHREAEEDAAAGAD